MKIKNVIINFGVILIILLLLILVFYKKNYSIKYKYNGYDILEKYDDDKYYIEVNNKYNYVFFNKRKIRKKIVKDLTLEKYNDVDCLKIKTSFNKGYSVCFDGSNLISYELVNKESKDEEKLFEYNNIEYSDGIIKNEYISIWNYDGFYLLNKSGIKTVSLFNKSKYTCDLCIQKDNYILVPNFEQEYQFNSFKLFNIMNGKTIDINSNYEISYDSRYVGEYKDSLFLFDQKYSRVYQIDINKKSISLFGSDEIGYFAYKDNKTIVVKKNDYVNKKINFFETDYLFDVNNNILDIKYNDNIKLKFDMASVKYITQSYDNIYYMNDDKLFRYNLSNGSELLFKNFEFNFNNNVFIYNN